MPLVEQILSRIKLWTSASLSYIRHLKLIKFVSLFHPGILVFYVYSFLFCYQED